MSVTELSGLSLSEIHGVKFNQHFVPTENYLSGREKELKPYNDLWEIIHKGSYPELYDIDRDWQEYYSSYVSTYRDTTNVGKDYKFNIFYYRGKDKNASGENEIDLVIEEDGYLYPIEIKMTGNPKANMGATNPVLDKIKEKGRGMGVILCLIDKK